MTNAEVCDAMYLVSAASACRYAGDMVTAERLLRTAANETNTRLAWRMLAGFEWKVCICVICVYICVWMYVCGCMCFV